MPARERPKKIDWVGLFQVVIVLAACAGLYSLLSTKQADKHSWKEVKQWLKQRGLSKLESSFQENGKRLFNTVGFLGFCLLFFSIFIWMISATH